MKDQEKKESSKSLDDRALEAFVQTLASAFEELGIPDTLDLGDSHEGTSTVDVFLRHFAAPEFQWVIRNLADQTMVERAKRECPRRMESIPPLRRVATFRALCVKNNFDLAGFGGVPHHELTFAFFPGDLGQSGVSYPRGDVALTIRDPEVANRMHPGDLYHLHVDSIIPHDADWVDLFERKSKRDEQRKRSERADEMPPPPAPLSTLDLVPGLIQELLISAGSSGILRTRLIQNVLGQIDDPSLTTAHIHKVLVEMDKVEMFRIGTGTPVRCKWVIKDDHSHKNVEVANDGKSGSWTTGDVKVTWQNTSELSEDAEETISADMREHVEKSIQLTIHEAGTKGITEESIIAEVSSIWSRTPEEYIQRVFVEMVKDRKHGDP